MPVVEPNTNPGRELEAAGLVVGGVGGMVVGIGMDVVLVVSIIVVDLVVVVVDVFSKWVDSMSTTTLRVSSLSSAEFVRPVL